MSTPASSHPDASARHRWWFGPLVCALLAVAVYLPMVRAEFVWDDRIVQTQQIPFLHGVGDLFSPPQGLFDWSDVYFRPVVTATYLFDDSLNRALYGPPSTRPDGNGPTNPLRARIPHATTVLTHAVATALVVLLARRLLGGAPRAELGAWAAGLTFALHPVHTDSVCAVAGRSDTLATLFVLAAVLLALRLREEGPRPWVAALPVLALLAFLSKEVALAGLVLIPLTGWFGSRGEARRGSGWLVGSLAAAGATYALLRLRSGAGESLPLDVAWADLPLRLGGAVAFYLGKLVVPWPLLPFQPEVAGPWTTALTLAATAGLLGWAVRAWRRGEGLPLLCLLWCGVALVPSLGIAVVRLAVAPVAERYLYLPSVGFCLGLGWLASRHWGPRPRGIDPAVALLAVGCAVYGAMTVQRDLVWQSDLSLWSDTVAREGPSRYILSWSNLGKAYLDRGELDKARPVLLRALEPSVVDDPDGRAIVLANLGFIEAHGAGEAFDAGRLEEAQTRYGAAEGYFTASIAQWPDFPYPHIRRGEGRILRFFLAQRLQNATPVALVEGACQDFRQALWVNGRDPRAQSHLTRCEELLSRVRSGSFSPAGASEFRAPAAPVGR
jgi:tetratricopeptide (TPR) repeat protein